VKGHEFAFEIMRKLQQDNSDILLHCTGVEESPEDLQNVVAHGWLEQEKKVELLQQSSLLILPSKWEGQPMVALEALACGTTVLASDSIHSLPDVVEKCSMEDVDDWIKHIHLMNSSPFGENLNEISNHRVEEVCSNLVQIYSSF
jgi:glycosyltransferase involved in cell wall biosynthesis